MWYRELDRLHICPCALDLLKVGPVPFVIDPEEPLVCATTSRTDEFVVDCILFHSLDQIREDIIEFEEQLEEFDVSGRNWMLQRALSIKNLINEFT